MLHTLHWELHRAANEGWAAELEQVKPGGAGGVCMEPHHCTQGRQASLAALCPLMGKPPRMTAWTCRSFKGTSSRHCRSSPDSPDSACCTPGKAGPSAGCIFCEGAAQHVVGYDPLLPLNHSSARSWQAGISRFWTEDRRKNRTALWIRNLLKSRDVAAFPNSLGIYFNGKQFYFLPKYSKKMLKRNFSLSENDYSKYPLSRGICLLLIQF